MRVILLGANGMLAHELLRTAPSEAAVLPFDRTSLDICDHRAVSSLLTDHRPDVVINAAAYTAVDRAEIEPAAARAANTEAVEALGRAACRQGTRVVHFSTDYVFDGTGNRPYAEDDETRPQTRYGISKLEGEKALAASGAVALVLRTQWLFGRVGRSFPRTMWERASHGQATRVVSDQTGRPTYAADLAQATWTLLIRGATGILHVANRGEATWYDVADVVFRAAGRADLLTACSTEDFPTSAPRPRYSVLATHRAEAILGGPLPDWRDALGRFLANDLN